MSEEFWKFRVDELLAELDQVRQRLTEAEQRNQELREAWVRDEKKFDDAFSEQGRKLTEAEAERDRLKEWKEAVIDAGVVSWTLSAENAENPRLAINDLLAWESKIALDPAVSKEAADLHERIHTVESRLSALTTALSEIMTLSGKWRQIASNARFGPRSSITGVRAKSFEACAADLEAFGAAAAGPPEALLAVPAGKDSDGKA